MYDATVRDFGLLRSGSDPERHLGVCRSCGFAVSGSKDLSYQVSIFASWLFQFATQISYLPGVRKVRPLQVLLLYHLVQKADKIPVPPPNAWKPDLTDAHHCILLLDLFCRIYRSIVQSLVLQIHHLQLESSQSPCREACSCKALQGNNISVLCT
jgi:hypothetical protein